MQLTDQPLKFPIPFADGGAKNTIPVPSQGSGSGAASLTDGFPPATRTPLSAGGIPPDGLDMNGILNEITAISNWQNAGGFFTYDSTFATAIGGYPKGALLLKADATGFWFNTVENNSTDPEAGGAGWAPQSNYGVADITGLTTGVVNLTSSQYSKEFLVLSGTLTGNVQIVVPRFYMRWNVLNNTTGAFSVTVKTATGTGVIVPQGSRVDVIGDGTNIVSGSADNSNAAVRFQKFTSNGSFIAKSTTTYLTGCGGGGGGGGGTGSMGGAGGGGGAFCHRLPVTTVVGATYTVTIGSGGAGGPGSTTGSAGTATSFGALLTLGGGSPGQNGSIGDGGGAGGSGSGASGSYGGGVGGSQVGPGAGGGGGSLGSGGMQGPTVGGTGLLGGGGGGGSNAGTGGAGGPGYLMVEW